MEEIMSVKGFAVAALCSASLVAGGCRADDQRTLDDPMTRNIPATETARTEAPGMGMHEGTRVSGQIERVDMDASTFTVTSAGMEHRFVFTGDTEVIGAAGTQGLASSEGDWVTVYYEDLPEGRKALRIELNDTNR
jgi:hypothetical protein